MYITTKDGLDAFCERAHSARVLAVDTEFLREKTFFPKLCLVQIATPTESVAIDPLLIEDISGLTTLFEDPSITKVLHAC